MFAPAPTKGPIPEGFRELVPGEITLPTDLVWVGGQGPWSSLKEEHLDAGYAYKPQPSPLAIGHFIHVRPA